MLLIDTDIAIHLRDRNLEVFGKIRALPSPPAISLLTLVELEAGVEAIPILARPRRLALNALLAEITILAFDAAIVTAYGRIVASCGFNRPRIIDRLIAATAIVHGLTLVTINAADFRDIPGLALEIWPAPGQ